MCIETRKRHIGHVVNLRDMARNQIERMRYVRMIDDMLKEHAEEENNEAYEAILNGIRRDMMGERFR